jgi:AcrR family transcriptional regulator
MPLRTPAFSDQSHERLTLRSVSTRAKLIVTAERLFAEHGLDGASLNEISRAAGQRNSNVCQYHFGNKDGLIQAILDKHLPTIAARRNEMLDEIEGAGVPALRDLARALIYPVAEKLTDPDGGPEFVRINAQLVALHTLYAYRMPASNLRLARAERFRRSLIAALAALGLPDTVAQQRMMLAAVLLFHGLADHTRMREATTARGPALDTGLFVANLEDSIVGLWSAPLTAAGSHLS